MGVLCKIGSFRKRGRMISREGRSSCASPVSRWVNAYSPKGRLTSELPRCPALTQARCCGFSTPAPFLQMTGGRLHKAPNAGPEDTWLRHVNVLEMETIFSVEWFSCCLGNWLGFVFFFLSFWFFSTMRAASFDLAPMCVQISILFRESLV